MNRHLLVALTALVLSPQVALFGASVTTPTSAARVVASGTAVRLLARLATRPEHAAGYTRSAFLHWIDADGNGCDTRDEVLIQESRTPARIGPGCAISGTWRSAYDGKTTTRLASFDIDHVVALKEAWDSGAWAWSPVRRESYANDLGDSRTLRAVSAASNRSKGEKDPAQWLPPLVSFRCTYATEWIAVKTRWSLAVDSSEKAALRRILTGCPPRTVSVVLVPADTAPPAPSPSTQPMPGPSGTASPAPSPTPAIGGCDPNYAGYCVPIVDHDLDCSDIKHRVTVIGVDIHHFDGDGVGIGCESYPSG